MTPRAIAVDIDDTLNDFSRVLRTVPVPFDSSWALPEDRFRRYLESVRTQAPETGELLSTEYSYFRFKVHELCFGLARARPDAAPFMQWLQAEKWRIVIATRRDLRRVGGLTRRWLAENSLPFDDLFMANNKIALCRAWGIPHLVDDAPFSLAHAAEYGVRLYYPLGPDDGPPAGAQGFRSFEEVKSWIAA